MRKCAALLALPIGITLRNSLSRGLAEISALLDSNNKPKTTEEWEDLADRRSSPAAVRLCAGIFSLYRRATGARESDPFLRDAQSWAAFEKAALPEMACFTFFDRARDSNLTPNAVLADAMYHIWTLDTLPNTLGTPTTIGLIGELAKHVCSRYEITPIDRRARKRASLGLDVVG
jgi:hypothetical protein